MIKWLQAGIFSFGISALLYDISHREDVPELARYALGGALIAAVMQILFNDDELTKKSFIGVTVAGIGVAINRMRLQILHG